MVEKKQIEVNFQNKKQKRCQPKLPKSLRSKYVVRLVKFKFLYFNPIQYDYNILNLKLVC